MTRPRSSTVVAHRGPATLSLALAAVLLALSTLPAQAQYQWRDAKGQLHVSDMPPPRDVPERSVLKRPPVTAQRAAAVASVEAASAALAGAPAPASAPASRPETDAEARRKRAEAEAQQTRQRAEESRLAALRADNCQRARQQLATLDSGQRLSTVNARGESVPMDDATRRAEADRARSAIASECR